MSLIVNSSAVDSVKAILNKIDDSAEIAEFQKLVRGCRPIEKHRLAPCAKTYKKYRRLFSLTTLAASERYGGKRCVAIYDDFQKAQRAVFENHGDIFEYSYTLAVIEPIYANVLYSYSARAYWFRWSKKKKGYEPIQTPERYKNTCGVGVG